MTGTLIASLYSRLRALVLADNLESMNGAWCVLVGAAVALASCSTTSSSPETVAGDSGASAGGESDAVTSGATSASSGTSGTVGAGGIASSGGDTNVGGAEQAGATGSDGGADPGIVVVVRPYCGGKSADLSTDAFNCGKCGNVCQPAGLASGLNAPGSVIADSKYVYWAEHIASGRVFQLPLGAAATTKPSAIASNQKNPRSLVVDATNVYWISDDAVWTRPIAGGKAVAIAPEPENRPPGGLALDQTSLYWTTHRDTAPSYAVVKKMPLGGGPAVDVAALDVIDFDSIAVNGTSVFWLDSEHEGSLTSGRWNDIIYKAPLGGGTPVEVFRFTPYTYMRIRDMAADASYLYLGTSENPPSFSPKDFLKSHVMRLPLAGGEPETLTTSLQEFYAGFDINSQGAFLATNNGNVVGGSLRFAPTGIGTPYSMEWPVHPTSVGVTETHLYLSAWEDNGRDEGTVYRIGLCVNSVCQ